MPPKQRFRSKIKLKPGKLGKHGYKGIVHLTRKKREQALASAIREYGPLSVMRKVNVLGVLNRRRPHLKKIYDQDKAWIYRHYDVKKNGKRKRTKRRRRPRRPRQSRR